MNSTVSLDPRRRSSLMYGHQMNFIREMKELLSYQETCLKNILTNPNNVTTDSALHLNQMITDRVNSFQSEKSPVLTKQLSCLQKTSYAYSESPGSLYGKNRLTNSVPNIALNMLQSSNMNKDTYRIPTITKKKHNFFSKLFSCFLCPKN